MKFVVDKFSVWIAPEQQISELTPLESSALTLSWVAPMQRRRLSPFMKMALHCLHEVTEGQHWPINFSSRHGDFHKTSGLLNSLCQNEPLSPTAFGLSVHNAAAGMSSILSGNTHAINAIASGNDSVISALLDGYARLYTNQCESIVICHADRTLPAEYLHFADEEQIDHCVALKIRLPDKDESHFSLTICKQPNNESISTLPLAVQLARYLLSPSPSMLLSCQGRAWELSYHE